MSAATIDRSEYSLEQIQAGFLRESWLWWYDLNDSETFKLVFNDFCLKELASRLTPKNDPQGVYINELLASEGIDPRQPETLSWHIPNEQEPVTNPNLGQIISLVFERGAQVQIDACFTFEIEVTSMDAEVLLYTLTIKKLSTWLFEVTELSRKSLTQESSQAARINDEL